MIPSRFRYLLRLSVWLYPLRRIHRPKSWIISDPSLRPIFISHIVETLQLDHHSVNFFEPMRTFTVLHFSLILWKSDSEKSLTPVMNPSASQSFTEFCIISDVDHTKIVAISCFKLYFSILSLQILNMEMRWWCCAVEHFLEEISIELINIIYSSSLRKWLFYCSKVITKEWSILSYNTILPSENIFDRLFLPFLFQKGDFGKIVAPESHQIPLLYSRFALHLQFLIRILREVFLSGIVLLLPFPSHIRTSAHRMSSSIRWDIHTSY